MSLQDKIDRVNEAGFSSDADPFSDVQKILEGRATARDIRGVSGDPCKAVLPPHAVPDGSEYTIPVSVSPSSYGMSTNAASLPQVQPIGTAYETVAQFNPGRMRILIQNVGTTTLYVIFGNASQVGGDTVTKYHAQILPNATFIDDMWQGRVDIASGAVGGKASIVEFSRTGQVSQ